MKYLLFAFFSFSLIVLVSFSYKMEVIPDPEEYARKMFEALRKNNEQEYVKVFSITQSDILLLKDQVAGNSNINSEERASSIFWLEDTAGFMSEVNARPEDSYMHIGIWLERELINVDSLEYVRMNYKLEYAEGAIGNYSIDRAYLYLKYKEKYYCFTIRKALYLNGRWVSGKVVDIRETNKYFHELSEGYGIIHSEYDYSLVSPTDSSAVDTAYAEYQYEETLNKKQQKIQKKIDALERKKYKLSY